MEIYIAMTHQTTISCMTHHPLYYSYQENNPLRFRFRISRKFLENLEDL